MEMNYPKMPVDERIDRYLKLTDSRYPIQIGGMAWAGNAYNMSLGANIGMVVFLGSGNIDPELLREQIKAFRLLAPGKKCGVNLIMLKTTKKPELEQLIQARINVCIEEGVERVATGAGLLTKEQVVFLKSGGCQLFAVVGHVRTAILAAELGYDFIVAEGRESGGHVGPVLTEPLVAEVVKDITHIPVVAAGNLKDYKDLAKMLELGVVAGQAGTVFLATTDFDIHENYKNAIVNAQETVVTAINRILQVRQVPNAFTDEFMKCKEEGASVIELEELCLGRLKLATVDGDWDKASFMAGDVAKRIRSLVSVKERADNFWLHMPSILPETSSLVKQTAI
ncbi:MAG: 2-nitropropane dioxygenase [candidate division CPR2 bacterium GW2011_GWC2_39_10]|uniref:2-nitropropane dioxygenase n=1 Tax=candidate division CPR2 bacterium GW2011_GWC2_39_10 TaxID=1618345 RepID=A0A0G0Q030_UNCC2|nr:MAG: 2-nitropropane dioxygenase [candidate division CPR2 bacterium GW2011_GWC2_39_10]